MRENESVPFVPFSLTLSLIRSHLKYRNPSDVFLSVSPLSSSPPPSLIGDRSDVSSRAADLIGSGGGDRSFLRFRASSSRISISILAILGSLGVPFFRIARFEVLSPGFLGNFVDQLGY